MALHKGTAKLCGTLAGVFAGLARDGFCAAPGETAGEGDGRGEKLLDDQAGTGIGAGEGKKDVSDEIEDEAQVLGMEDLQKEERAGPEAPPDDAGQGLEMGADFEGETHELQHDAEEEEEPPAETAEDQLDKEVRACAAFRLPSVCLHRSLAFGLRHSRVHCVDDRRFTSIAERNLMAESKGLSSGRTRARARISLPALTAHAPALTRAAPLLHPDGRGWRGR